MKKILMGALLACIAVIAPTKAQAAASDGKEKIAFVSNRDGNNEIYITNADGTGTATRLTNNAADDINPCISPDGNKILWSSNRNGDTHDLYEANIDGSSPVRLTTVGDSLQPAYSPDGQKIVFASNLDGSLYNIWIINHDLSHLLKLTNGDYSSYHPNVSPDGQQIVFNSTIQYRDGMQGINRLAREIFKVNADGSGEQRLTRLDQTFGIRLASTNPAWSSLDAIAFTTTTGSTSEIYTMDASGAAQKNITNNAAVDADAAWSPDGRKIAFTSKRDGNSQIYIINADGSGTPVRLTNNTASDSTPSWGPPTNTPLPHALRVSDVSVAEGNSGPTNAVFTVTLYAAQTGDVTVHYATGGGTATPGTDYTPKQGDLTFHAGETSKTVSVPIINDALDEDDETFNLVLTNPVNATVAQAQATATINDDDPLPLISVDSQSKAEGNAGTSVMTFHATLSAPSGRTVTVKYATVNETADAEDYVPASGTLTFAPGTVSQNIPITIKGDVKPEGDETFAIALSEPTNVAFPVPRPVFNPSNNHYYELVVANTNWDTARAAAEARTVAGVKGHLVTITPYEEWDFIAEQFHEHSYLTGGIRTSESTDPAYPDGGFSWITGEPFTYSNWYPGEPNGTGIGDVILVASNVDYPWNWKDIAHDSICEGYLIEYDTTAPANLNGGTCTILNDDIALNVSDTTLAEGNSGTKDAVFTVSLYTASTKDVTVHYETGGGSATPGSDYTAKQGDLTFHSGDMTKTVVVPVIGDVLNEDDETFNLTLSNSVNATIDRAQAVATITNDDPLPTIAVDKQSKTEGPAQGAPAGTSIMTFHATLSAPSSRTITVRYATVNQTADADDYVPASGTLTFAPGTTSQNIPITIKGDTKPEADETFDIALSEPTNVILLSLSAAFNPSNQHYYELVTADVNWVTAKAAAEAKTLGGVKGHLVTITSAAEQEFLNAHFYDHSYFTGGVQPPGSTEPAGGFTWITGEPFTYSKWHSGEPSNAEGIEDVILFCGTNSGADWAGTWNDIPRTYIGKEKYGYVIDYVIEYDTTAPASVNAGIGTILNDDGPVPPQPWNAADLAVGSDNLARLLWQRPDHAFALWTLSASNAINSTPLLGPINGWNAPAIGVDSDGKIRALLNNINGASAAWTVQNPATGSITSTPAYAPPGFICREIAAAPNNTTRLLWVRSDGAFAIWTVDGGGSFTSTPLFGPVAGWSANAISVGGDNKTTILLNSTDGRAAVWTVQNASTGAFTSTAAYGPISGFSCRDIATGSDNKTRMLWVRTDGAFAVWTATAASAANNYTSTPLYGPIAGWAGIKLGVGGDLKTRVLLTHTDGRAAVWTIESNSQFTSTPAYGPIAYQPASRALVQAATGAAP